MTKPNSTLIVMVLDRSGSMGDQQKATLEGLHQFIRDQKKVPGECRMTLVQFDDRYEVNFAERPISDVNEPDIVYAPRGGTALLDAMGRAIWDTGRFLEKRPESDRPSKVIFVTITDGFENASLTYSRRLVFDMIAHQREVYKWEFIYLGANQDAIHEATALGIPATHAMSWNSGTHAGTMHTYGAMSASVSGTRTGKSVGISNQVRKEYNSASGSNTAEQIPEADATAKP